MDATIKGHLAQARQGTLSTRPRPVHASEDLQRQPSDPVRPTDKPIMNPMTPSRKLHIMVKPLSRLFTDDTGRFPFRTTSGNQYVMIAYHADSNAILAAPFQSKHDCHRLAAYNAIMTRLHNRGHTVDLQVLDNKASATITQTWKATYQLVPPNMHRRNAAERAMPTFKDHFLAILASVDPAFPKSHWDLLIPHAELTLNLLRQAMVTPTFSAWE
jgi:hypothetical protein